MILVLFIRSKNIERQVDKFLIIKRRINDLLYLEQNITNAIYQEIRETSRGQFSNIIEILKYIIDDSNIVYYEKPKERDIE